ncbi:MAG: MarR family winged helix-turn-helix transcriptional regulator [Pararhodobacter sp.]
MTASKPNDHVDRLRSQWARELPDLDTGAMAVLGRARRLALIAGPGIEAIFARHGLDRGEFDVISTLRRAGPPYRLTPTQLYSTLMVSSGGMTHRLVRLQRAGLIRRVPSQSDRRSTEVALTDRGRALAEAAIREDMAHEALLLAPLDMGERRQLADLLRKVLEPLERNG